MPPDLFCHSPFVTWRMRDLRVLTDGSSALALSRPSRNPHGAPSLRAVKDDVYARLARRRRKAQMAARRALGVHDDMRRAF